MKKILMLLMLATFTSMAFSQSEANTEDVNYFIVLYTVGDSWDQEKEAHEQPYFDEHSAHLAALRKGSKISLGGRYGDVGLIIIKAKDVEEADAMITSDSAIKHGIFSAEILAFDPFYKGCVD